MKRLIVFTASWCNPCRSLKKLINENLLEIKPGVYFYDVDGHPELATQYGIRGVPTMILLDDGKEIDRSGQKMFASSLLEFTNQ